jgi:hypothetical protein
MSTRPSANARPPRPIPRSAFARHSSRKHRPRRRKHPAAERELARTPSPRSRCRSAALGSPRGSGRSQRVVHRGARHDHPSHFDGLRDVDCVGVAYPHPPSGRNFSGPLVAASPGLALPTTLMVSPLALQRKIANQTVLQNSGCERAQWCLANSVRN